MTDAGQPAAPNRTPAKHKARQLAKYLRCERPDYTYLKEVFRHLRDELGVQASPGPTKLPYVPTEAEIRRYYQTVWTTRRTGDIVLIKTLLYTAQRSGPCRQPQSGAFSQVRKLGLTPFSVARPVFGLISGAPLSRNNSPGWGW